MEGPLTDLRTPDAASCRYTSTRAALPRLEATPAPLNYLGILSVRIREEASLSYQLGVDLGTTFTAPAVCRPDPDITTQSGVVGTRIVLDFTGGESAECGGFAELIVSGSSA